MDVSYFCTPDDFLENFDVDLQCFYQIVLSKELDMFLPANAAGIKRALKEVTNAYSKSTVDLNASSIRFDTQEKRCAYVMKHCPCFSSAIARHFSQMLSANPLVLEGAFRRRRINLCCLGGGPATDAVGVVRVLNALNNSVLVRSPDRLLLTVWVVDLNEEWRTTASLVLETLSEVDDFCNSERISLDFRFLRANLTEPWGQPLREVLNEADIVTTMYFVSAVNGSKDRGRCLRMLQNIMDALKPGALFFFLDSAKAIHCDAVLNAASSFSNLKQIYGPRLQSFHTLSMESIKKFIELYFAHFNAILCLTNCFITSCGWVKEGRDSSIAVNGVQGCKGNRRWEKRVALNTRRQEIFRKRVERLLLLELNLDFAIDDLDDREGSYEPDCEGKVVNASKSKWKRIYT